MLVKIRHSNEETSMSYSPNRPNKERSLYNQMESWMLYNTQGWKQEDIAKRLGISQAAVSKLIRKTDLEYIRRLHKYGFSPRWNGILNF